MKIGDIAKATNLTPDTLRYYEKIALLPKIEKNTSGIRTYHQQHIEQLAFIKRAQKTGFSLEEIKQLLSLRNTPNESKPQVRSLAKEKLITIDQHLAELKKLKKELTELIQTCEESDGDCPILENFAKGEQA